MIYMRKTIVFLCIIMLAACSAPPEDVTKAGIKDSTGLATYEGLDRAPINKEASTFTFEGFGPGKSHVGTFNSWEGELFLEDGKIVGGKGEVQVSSVKTDSERVDSHLQTDDFFDAEKCPTIAFTSKNFDGETMTGDLTFHCITKEVSFPATVTDEGVSADFILDIKPYEFKYAKLTGDARIQFRFVK